MKIYAIRWLSRIDGEEECGNFDVCYTDEEKARKAMLEDMKDTKADWEKDGNPIESRTLGPNGEEDEDCDYAEISVNGGNYDYHEWWIDALDVE